LPARTTVPVPATAAWAATPGAVLIVAPVLIIALALVTHVRRLPMLLLGGG
jgi:hypothetical protein